MPKHAERRNMPEGPHLCMQMTKIKLAKIKQAEARGKKKETCRKDRIFVCKGPHLNMPKSNMPKHVAVRNEDTCRKDKLASIKHAESRGKKKHAGRTASLHANDQFHLTDSF